MSLFSRLYHGETRMDFVGRRRRWLTGSRGSLLLNNGGKGRSTRHGRRLLLSNVGLPLPGSFRRRPLNSSGCQTAFFSLYG